MSGVILLVLRIALVGVLYAFLGFSLWILWQDLRRQSKIAMEVQAPPLVLVPRDQETPEARRFAAQTTVVVGRDLACDCRLEDKTISARHARLTYHHSQWWLEDLHSRNGTFLNNEPIAGAVVVTSGDVLQFGQVIFEILLGESS